MKNTSIPLQYFIIFSFSLFLYSIFFVGFYGSDDLQYASGIRFFAGLSGGEITNIGSLRFTLVLPAAVFAKIGGAVQWAFISQLIYFLILALLIKYILHKTESALISTLGTLSCLSAPIVSIFSPSLLPDTILTTYILLHAILLEKSINNKFNIFICGVILGLIYSSKEASMIYMLPWWAYLLYKFLEKGWKEFFLNGVLYASGFMAVFSIDTLIQFYATDAILPRLSGGLDAAQKARAFMDRQGYLPNDRLRFALNRLDKGYSFIHLIIITPILIAIALSRGIKNIRFEIAIYASGIWIFIYNTFGSISFSEYIGVPIQSRYYMPSQTLLLISAIMLISKVLSGSLGKIFISMGLIILTVVHIIFALPVAGKIYGASNYRLTAAAVEKATGINKSPIFFSKNIFARTRYGTMDAVKPWPENEQDLSDCRYWLLTDDAGEISEIKRGKADTEFNIYPVTSPRSRMASIAQMYGLGPIFPEKVSNFQLIYVDRCKETKKLNQERF